LSIKNIILGQPFDLELILKRHNLKIKEVLFSASDLDITISRIVHEILENIKDFEKVAIVGVRTRGVHIGKRIHDKIEKIKNIEIPFGTVDISLYRDDFFNQLPDPDIAPSEINFNVEEYNIILVDDVLFSGRSARAAIDVIIDYGRPLSIKLAILIDRGHRELPIQPDFVGKVVETKKDTDLIAIYLKESDGEDKIALAERNPI